MLCKDLEVATFQFYLKGVLTGKERHEILPSLHLSFMYSNYHMHSGHWILHNNKNQDQHKVNSCFHQLGTQWKRW